MRDIKSPPLLQGDFPVFRPIPVSFTLFQSQRNRYFMCCSFLLKLHLLSLYKF
eukprot:c40444_g1_i1 orf=128-286(+)